MIRGEERGLSASQLKLLAAIAMVVDHIGYFFLPDVMVLRYIGRLAMPIFAFMIAEGCLHTRNRWAYSLRLMVLGGVCQAVFYFTTGESWLCVPMSFALAVPVCCSFHGCREAFAQRKAGKAVAWSALFAGALLAVWVIEKKATIDYGFWGCMIPLAASLFPRQHRLVRLAPVAVCLFATGLDMGLWQMYSLAAIPVLSLYNGKRGAMPMKYAFYIFYPAHLALLQGIVILWPELRK